MEQKFKNIDNVIKQKNNNNNINNYKKQMESEYEKALRKRDKDIIKSYYENYVVQLEDSKEFIQVILKWLNEN